MTYARVNSGAEPFASNRAAHEIRSYQVSMPAGGRSGIDTRGDAVSRIPADFDRAGFERNAKLQFIRLQAANDARDLDDIRQFTTPEMFAELKLEIAERGTSPQKTEVVCIQAEVLEVDQDPQRYLVSVRFTGVCTVTIGVGAAEPDEPFNEIWHLTKPRQGDGGWVLCGIQQLD
jgi:predicted lipid-binding transport protein (Tim44 family)